MEIENSYAGRATAPILGGLSQGSAARDATFFDKVRERIAEAHKLALETRSNLAEANGRIFGAEPMNEKNETMPPSAGVADDILNGLSALLDTNRDNMIRARGLNQRL